MLWRDKRGRFVRAPVVWSKTFRFSLKKSTDYWGKCFELVYPRGYSTYKSALSTEIEDKWELWEALSWAVVVRAKYVLRKSEHARWEKILDRRGIQGPPSDTYLYDLSHFYVRMKTP